MVYAFLSLFPKLTGHKATPRQNCLCASLPVACRLLASAYYCKKLCLLCDGEDKAATEVHKSIPALCVLLDRDIKKAKQLFSLSVPWLFRKIPSRLLLNPLVRPPGRHDGCTPHLVPESRPGGAFAARENQLVHIESPGRWRLVMAPGTGWGGMLSVLWGTLHRASPSRWFPHHVTRWQYLVSTLLL